MSDVVIFGTTSSAQVAHFYFEHDSGDRIVAFTVHEAHMQDRQYLGLPVVPFEEIEHAYPPEACAMFVAIGYSKVNQLRAGIYQEAKAKGYRMSSYVSSKCTHWGDTEIGDNCFILEDNTLQPFVTIGNDVVLWSGNHIGHHSSIGDHCFITSQVVVSGWARIGAYSFLGVNSTVRDNISVGERCVIGAGSIIMKATQDGEVYIPRRTERYRLKSDEIGM